MLFENKSTLDLEDVHFPESLEHHNDVLYVLLKCIWEYEYIIKIYMYKFSVEILDCYGH